MTHMHRLLITFLFCSWFGVCHAEAPKKWVVYYGDKEPAESFLEYDVIAFDRDNHPPLRQLLNRDRALLGYVSFGEAEKYRHDFKDIEALGVLLEENPSWPGHFVVDIRKPQWTKYVIEVVIPDIMHQGFNGIIIDTLDSVEDLEASDSKKYEGMTQAAIRMVHAVRVHYPKLKIMVNRGFNTLPGIAKDIDYVLAESVMVQHQPDDKTYKLFPPEVYQEYVGRLNDLKKQAPHLTIVSVDYWDMNDPAGIKHIYDTNRANGYLPYVTTIDLNNFHPETRR